MLEERGNRFAVHYRSSSACPMYRTAWLRHDAALVPGESLYSYWTQSADVSVVLVRLARTAVSRARTACEACTTASASRSEVLVMHCSFSLSSLQRFSRLKTAFSASSSSGYSGVGPPKIRSYSCSISLPCLMLVWCIFLCWSSCNLGQDIGIRASQASSPVSMRSRYRIAALLSYALHLVT